MELYQIGRFLDLDILSQNCEDAIVQRLNQTNLADVLDWSGQPYGSPWVNRQAHQFLLEDFAHIPLSPSLERISMRAARTSQTWASTPAGWLPSTVMRAESGGSTRRPTSKSASWEYTEARGEMEMLQDLDQL